MPIIGKLIKTAIDISNEFQRDVDPLEAQGKVLKRLLSKAKNTRFGKRYDFQSILDAQDIREKFRETVPVYDYDRLFQDGWEDVIEGDEDVTWPGKPHYFAISAGTTGAKKRIPVSDEMLQAIRDTGVQQILSLNNFDLPVEFFEKDILMFGSSSNLKDNDGRKEGQISGISANRIPFWFRSVYKPGNEIASIDDWDERTLRVAEEAPNWDIGAICGIPTWIEIMLKKVVKHNKLENIHDIWPGLRVYASGGVAFEPYRKSLERLMGKPLIYIDTYLASEGFFGFQTRPETHSMALVTNGPFYFEFIPFESEFFEGSGAPKPDTKSFHLGEIKEGKEYVMLISSVSGAWRYCMGDTIRFTDKDRAEIRITGRTKHFLNVAGSELTVDDMHQCMEFLEDQLGVAIPEFTVSPIEKGENYFHFWYLGAEDNLNGREKEIAGMLDQYLIDRKKTYANAREGKLLTPKVETIPDEVFHNYAEHLENRGGQTKIPRVMDEDKFMHFQSFIIGELQD